MVFEHVAGTKDLFQRGRRLLDNGGIGNSDDDALLAVAQGMVQRERKRCQRLSTTGGNLQREDARLAVGCSKTLGEHLSADSIDRLRSSPLGTLGQYAHMVVEH